MQFDLREVPFSTRGSYMAVSRHEAGFRGRNNDLRIYGQIIRPVYQSRFIIFFRYSGIELPYQKNVKCTSEKTGQRQRYKSIVSPHRLPDQKLRYHEHRLWYHHR